MLFATHYEVIYGQKNVLKYEKYINKREKCVVIDLLFYSLYISWLKTIFQPDLGYSMVDLWVIECSILIMVIKYLKFKT